MELETIDFVLMVLLFVLCGFYAGVEAPMKKDEQKQQEQIKPTATETSLHKMWDQQVEFMRLLQKKRNFPEFPVDLSSKKGQQFLNDIRNHLMEELFEAGQHLKNAKSHRVTELPQVDRDAYKEELADVLHLYFELLIASGITLDEIVETYMTKGEINVARINNNY